MTELLAELHGKWKDLSEEEQLALSNAIAGKTQASVFQSLMQNYETYEQMMSQFGKNDHIGSAMQENAKYIDSVAGKLAQLKATWTGIATTVFQSDTIKGFLDGFNAVSEVIGKVISKIDEMGLGLPTTIASIATAVKLFGSIRDAGSITGGITSFGTSIANFLSQASTVKSIGDYFSLIGKSSKSASSSVSTIAGEMVELAGETAVATTGGLGLKTALVGLGKVALPIAGVIGLGVAIKKTADYIEHQRTQSIRQYDELSNSIKEHRSALNEATQGEEKLTSLYNKYSELSGITNKTKAQQEEYNQVLKELASIDPDLVLYDEKGNPIQARIGEVKDLIREYQKAQREQKRLLQGDLEDRMKTGYDAYKAGLTDYQKAISDLAKFRNEHLTGANGLAKDGGDLVNSVIAGYKGADKNANDYFNQLNEYKEKEAEFIAQIVADRKEVSQSSSDWLEGLFGQNDKLEEIGKKRQTAMESILGLDFSQFDGESMENLGKKLNTWLGNADYADVGVFNDYIKSVNELNKAWEDGEVTSATYKKGVNEIAQTLSELTGGKISTEEWAKLLKLPEFDVEDAYKTFSDLDEAKQTLQEKVNEMAQIESLEGRIELAYEILQDDRVPMEIKQSVEDMLSDGQVTDQELEVLLELIGKLEEGDLENTINEELDKLSEQKEITKEVAIDFATKVKNGVDFDQYLQEIIDESEGGITLAVDIQTDMDGGDLESLKNDLAQLPQEKQIGILLASYESGEYSLTQIHDFLQQVPPEVRSAVLAVIQSSGDLTPEEYDKLVNGAPTDKTTTVSVKTEGVSKTKGELQEVRANAQDEQKTVTTSTPNSGSTINTLNTINGLSSPESKPVNTSVPGSAGTISTLSRIIGLSNPETKTVTTINNGGSSTLSTLQSIASSIRNRSQTITTYFKTVGTRISSVVSSAGGGRWTQSTGNFSNVSETPSEVSAQGEVSAVSDMPTETPSDSGYSAKASNGDIGKVNSSATRPTTIKVNYDNVWKSIKYGINLFQELENRISRVQNNLELLDSRMENAVGTKKISYLQTQIKLFKEEAKVQKEYYKALQKEESQLGKKAKTFGFNINSQGNLTNYDETLRKLEKQAEDAEKKAQKAQDKASNYSGKSKSKQNSLEKSADKAQAKADKANEKLENAKKVAQEYLDVINDKLPGAEKAWQDLQNSIKEANDEIEKLRFEQKIYKEQHALEELTAKYDQYSNYLERTRIRKENLGGSQYIAQIQKEADYLNELIDIQQDYQDQLSSERKDYRTQLKKYGATFDENGQMTNQDTILNKYYNSSDYEKIKGWIEEYIELTNEQRDVTNELIDLNNELNDTYDELEQKKLEQKIYKEQNAIDELSSSYEQYSNYLERTQIRKEGLQGQEYIDQTKKEIEQVKQLIQINKDLQKQNSSMKKDYMSTLGNYGAIFDENGQITNEDSILNNYFNTDDYDRLKDWIAEYKELLGTHRDLTNENIELQNEIKSLNNEVKKLELAETVSEFTNAVENATQRADRLNNEIDILDAKLQHATGTDKLNLLQQQIGYYEEMADWQEIVLTSLRTTEKEYASILSSYGFNFDDYGNITNKGSQLKSLENNDSYEYIKDTLELWEELYDESIPNAERAIVDYGNAIKDAYKEQLNVTKEVEDKITEMYKKQIEERKKTIEDETNEIINQLEKQKKAYQDMRAEAEYEDEYNEKSNEIADLQRQLDIARKDDSLGNRKKIADLEKQLADAQEELSDLVQGKIDQDVEDMYDDQIDAVEEKQNTLIEELEEYWSDAKIAEMVAESLKTGLFEGIDGSVTNLQDAMLTFGEETGEMFGVTGQLIRDEWVGNLEIALATMQDISDIMTGINTNFGDFSSSNPNTTPMLPPATTVLGEGVSTEKSVSTGDININVKTEGEVNAQELATIISDAVSVALGEAIEGL